jgi:hypothetical protein
VLHLPCLSAELEVADQVSTDFGELQVVRLPYEDGTYGPPSKIMLNGKEIFLPPNTEPYVSLHGTYRLRNGQAVLASSNCGGSGCRIDPLLFILLSKRGPPRVVTHPDFFSEINVIKAIGKSGKVIVDLGYYRQKKKIAVLELGNLSIAFKKSTNRRLIDDECKSLYAALNACIRPHSSPSGCPNYSNTDFATGGFSGSNAEVWHVRFASHYPGFNRDGFIESCNSACASGTLKSYEVFRSQACTMPRPSPAVHTDSAPAALRR